MKISDVAAAMVGNLLEHYDTALFGLLSPFLAPLFFPEHDPITALILTYAVLPLGIIVKPLGSLFFGRLSDLVGIKKVLFFSLFGTAICTICMGLLPTYAHIGISAPLLLAATRMLQGFFAAGESINGAVCILDIVPKTKKTLFSSFYDVTSIGGGILASASVFLLRSHTNIAHSWRIAFLGGGITAIAGIFLRLHSYLEKPPSSSPSISLKQLLQHHKKVIFSVSVACGFSHLTYLFAFTFMNGFTPLVTDFSSLDMLNINTKLLILDMCLLPCFGLLAHKVGKEKVMLFGALGISLLAPGLFSLLYQHPSYATVLCIRITLVVLGAAFAAPYYAWALQQTSAHHRYLILGLATSIGSQLWAAPSQFLCLWLYQVTGWSIAPSLYFVLFGGLISCILWLNLRRMPKRLYD